MFIFVFQSQREHKSYSRMEDEAADVDVTDINFKFIVTTTKKWGIQ